MDSRSRRRSPSPPDRRSHRDRDSYRSSHRTGGDGDASYRRRRRSRSPSYEPRRRDRDDDYERREYRREHRGERRRSRTPDSPPAQSHSSKSRYPPEKDEPRKRSSRNTSVSPPRNAAPMDAVDFLKESIVTQKKEPAVEMDEEAMMRQMLGFSGFTTTKGTSHEQTDESAVYIPKKRDYRQYMNKKSAGRRPPGLDD